MNDLPFPHSDLDDIPQYVSPQFSPDVLPELKPMNLG